MPPPDRAVLPGRASARPALPLDGLTLLVVDDSRFACEALRLLCLRLGARLRRAETLEQAERHLSLYRPDVAIVDLGLPDGDGAALIAALAARPGLRPVVLATSGNPAERDRAMQAGADGFLDKPLASLRAVQAAILHHLAAAPAPPQEGATPALPAGDSLALLDDLAHAAALLPGAGDEQRRRYVTGFLASLGQSARDEALARAARAAAEQPQELPGLAALVAARLAAAPGAFAPQETPISLSPPAG